MANPPKIPPKSTASSIEHVYLRVRNLFSGHPLLSLTTLITAAVLLSLWLRRQMRRGRFFGASGSGGGGGGSIGGGGGGGGGGFFHLDMKEGHLLGGTGTANGKVD